MCHVHAAAGPAAHAACGGGPRRPAVASRWRRRRVARPWHASRPAPSVHHGLRRGVHHGLVHHGLRRGVHRGAHRGRAARPNRAPVPRGTLHRLVPGRPAPMPVSSIFGRPLPHNPAGMDSVRRTGKPRRVVACMASRRLVLSTPGSCSCHRAVPTCRQMDRSRVACPPWGSEARHNFPRHGARDSTGLAVATTGSAPSWHLVSARGYPLDESHFIPIKRQGMRWLCPRLARNETGATVPPSRHWHCVLLLVAGAR